MPRSRVTTSLVLPAVLLVALPGRAQLPEFYRNVHGMVWVVKDVDEVAAAWMKLGLAEVVRHGEVKQRIEYRGKPGMARLKWVSGRLGPVLVDFYQPLEGTNAWSDFLARHGDGVMSLVYLAGSPDALERETERLKAAGVSVLQRADGRVYFDTEPNGKYVLALAARARTTTAAAGPRITQFAFVVSELAPVFSYWKKLGFPEFSVTHPALTDLFYRGRPAAYEQDLGWQRHGAVPFEWCVPPAGTPSVYAEYLKKHGEGVQHIAFSVPDMDAAIVHYKSLGFAAVQGGGWGEAGKPGSGRFAYLDTDAAGGLTIELLWNYGGK